MTVVDASAIVAVIRREPGHEAIEARMLQVAGMVANPITVFEAALALARDTGDLAGAIRELGAFLDANGFEIVPIVAEDARLGVDAHQRFGKGRGSPARLNMGDCFTYATARRLGGVLVYKGDDFASTDLA